MVWVYFVRVFMWLYVGCVLYVYVIMCVYL